MRAIYAVDAKKPCKEDHPCCIHLRPPRPQNTSKHLKHSTSLTIQTIYITGKEYGQTSQSTIQWYCPKEGYVGSQRSRGGLGGLEAEDSMNDAVLRVCEDLILVFWSSYVFLLRLWESCSGDYLTFRRSDSPLQISPGCILLRPCDSATASPKLKQPELAGWAVSCELEVIRPLSRELAPYWKSGVRIFYHDSYCWNFPIGFSGSRILFMTHCSSTVSMPQAHYVSRIWFCSLHWAPSLITLPCIHILEVPF